MTERKPFAITVQDLVARGRNDIPAELITSTHLIYNSPAALAFNSPGAQGFGVKRAGLSIPGSVMILIGPGCCGRNTTILSEMGGYSDRFFFYIMDETDIVTGRHLKKMPQAVCEVVDSLPEKPVGRHGLHDLCRRLIGNRYGTGLPQGGTGCGTARRALLHVRLDPGRAKAADGRCQTGHLFPLGKGTPSATDGQPLGLFFALTG